MLAMARSRVRSYFLLDPDLPVNLNKMSWMILRAFVLWSVLIYMSGCSDCRNFGLPNLQPCEEQEGGALQSTASEHNHNCHNSREQTASSSASECSHNIELLCCIKYVVISYPARHCIANINTHNVALACFCRQLASTCCANPSLLAQACPPACTVHSESGPLRFSWGPPHAFTFFARSWTALNLEIHRCCRCFANWFHLFLECSNSPWI